jgi:hypothetical protein
MYTYIYTYICIPCSLTHRATGKPPARPSDDNDSGDDDDNSDKDDNGGDDNNVDDNNDE